MKYRGVFRVTNEKLAALLGFPKEVQIIGVEEEKKRDITSIIINSADHVKGWTEPTEEAMSAELMHHVGLENYGEFTAEEINTYERVRNALAGTEEGEGVL